MWPDAVVVQMWRNLVTCEGLLIFLRTLQRIDEEVMPIMKRKSSMSILLFTKQAEKSGFCYSNECAQANIATQ